MPANMLAWNLYWDSKSSCASALTQLEGIELSGFEAADVAMKIRVLTGKENELELRQLEQQKQEMKNASSTARH